MGKEGGFGGWKVGGGQSKGLCLVTRKMELDGQWRVK